MRATSTHRAPASRGVHPLGLPKRQAFTFLEVLLAAAMIAVLCSVAGQLMVNMKRQTRLTEQQALALRTIDNSMEQLTALPWEEINDDAIAALQLPAAVQDRWPSAALTGKLTTSTDPVEAKRISLSLTLAPDARARPASLTTWIYRRPRT
jgi:type II secretory pathway pseudopilin PulG